MTEVIRYESSVSEWISGFVHEKQSLGYKYYNESKWMRHFDRYWIEHGYRKEGLTQENIAEWIKNVMEKERNVSLPESASSGSMPSI